MPSMEEPIIRLLCEWAVSTQRMGEYCARVVATLLERRQNELTSEVCSGSYSCKLDFLNIPVTGNFQ